MRGFHIRYRNIKKYIRKMRYTQNLYHSSKLRKRYIGRYIIHNSQYVEQSIQFPCSVGQETENSANITHPCTYNFWGLHWISMVL